MNFNKLFKLVFLIVFSIIIIQNVYSICSPPATGNWEICDLGGGCAGSQDCANRVIIMNGNITLSSSDLMRYLRFNNVTLKFNNSFDGQYGLKVFNSGGTNNVYIYDNDNNSLTAADASNITNNKFCNGTSGCEVYGIPAACSAAGCTWFDKALFFVVNGNSEFQMRNSFVSRAGWIDTIEKRGIEINLTESRVSNFSGNTIYDSYYGLSVYSANNSFSNSTFQNNTRGIYILGAVNNIFSNLMILNSSASGVYLRYSANNNTLNNVTIKNTKGSLGGLVMQVSNNTLIINSNFINNTPKGLYSYDSMNNIFVDSYFTGNYSLSSYYDITHGGSNNNNTLINSTFNQSKILISTGNLWVKKYFSVAVYESNHGFSAPVVGANVTAWDIFGVKTFSVLTATGGKTPILNTTEYMQNSSDIYNFTPYYVEGYKAFSGFGNITASSLILDAGPVILLICNPPKSGNWIIANYSCNLNNTEALLNGNITLMDNGNLTLNNATIIFNSTFNGEYGITTQSTSKFIVDSSNITTLNQSFFFFAGDNSLFSMNNSFVSGAGWNHTIGQRGIEANTTINFTNNFVQNNFYGLTLYKNNNIITNNIIINNTDSIYLDNSDSNFVYSNNLSYNKRAGIFLDSSDSNNITGNKLFYNNDGYNDVTDNCHNVNGTGTNGYCGYGIFSKYSFGNVYDDNWIRSDENANYSSEHDATLYGNNSCINNAFTCDNSTWAGILLWQDNNSLIYNNTIEFTDTYGIHLYNTLNISLINNFENGTGNFGRITNDGTILAGAVNTTILNNTFYGNTEWGIFLANAFYNNISNNNLQRNKIVGIRLGGYSNFNLVKSNNISYNGINISFMYTGMRIEGSNNTIKDNNLKENYNGFVFYPYGGGLASYNLLENNTITNATFVGVYFASSANYNNIIDSIINGNYSDLNSKDINNSGLVNTFTNTSFNKSRVVVSAGTLYFKWYLDVFVNQTNNSAVNNANISANDKNNLFTFNMLTNSSGQIARQNITEYYQTPIGSYYYTNYTINASKTNFTTQSKQLNITESTLFVFELNGYPIILQNQTFADYPAEHIYNITANATDADGLNDIISCTLYHKKSTDGSWATKSGVYNNANGVCNVSISNSDVNATGSVYQPNNIIASYIRFADSKGEYANTSVASHTLPNRAPGAFSITIPSAGTLWNGTRTITWTASTDADSDAINYSIDYNGGSGWVEVNASATGTSQSWITTDFGDSNSINSSILRIEATDRYNTTLNYSAYFTVDNTAPNITDVLASTNTTSCMYISQLYNSTSKDMIVHFNSNLTKCIGQKITIQVNFEDITPDKLTSNDTFGDGLQTNNDDATELTINYIVEANADNQTANLTVYDKVGKTDSATVYFIQNNNLVETTDNSTEPIYWHIDQNATIQLNATLDNPTHNVTQTKYCIDDYNPDYNPKAYSGNTEEYCGYYCSNGGAWYTNVAPGTQKEFISEINISCDSGKQSCQKVLVYYSNDTRGQAEGIRKCSYPINIVYGSYVANKTAWLGEIKSNSIIINSTNYNCTIDASTENNTYCNESTMQECLVENSNTNNSLLAKSGSKNCIVKNSDILDSTINSSEIYNSTIDPSTIIESIIINSNITNSTVEYSTVRDTDFCGDFQVFSAGIDSNILTSGRIIYNGITYYAPFNISSICANMNPRPIGVLWLEPDLFNNNTEVILYYNAGAVGYSVTIDLSTIGGVGVINLYDNGIYPDEAKDDGVYTNLDTITNEGDSNYTITATVNDNVGNVLYANATAIVDNANPEAIISINNENDKTTKEEVTLSLTYSDANGIYKCRYSNNETEINSTNWEFCTDEKAWNLIPGYGERTVYYDVQDNAGNINSTNDSILLEPNAPIIITPLSNLYIYGIQEVNSYASDNTLKLVYEISGGYALNGLPGTTEDTNGSDGWVQYWDTTAFSDGIYNLTATAYTQFLGIYFKTGETTNYNITIDRTAPTASLLINDEASTTFSNLVYLKMNYTDVSQNLYCRLSENPLQLSNLIWETCVNERTWQLSSGNGTKTIYMEVKDPANNSVVINDSIDYLTSGIEITYPYANSTVSGVLNITFTDINSNPEISIDGSSWTATSTSYSHEWNTTQWSNDAHNIQVRNTDTSGNYVYSNILLIYVDNNAPLGVLTATPSTAENNETLIFEYNAAEKGLTASINSTELQKIDSTASAGINLLDNGLSPDKKANDGVYTASHTINESNTIPNGDYDIYAVINDNQGNLFTTYATITLQNGFNLVTSCGSIDESSILINNVQSDDDCFTINCSNCTLDCNNYLINVSPFYTNGTAVQNSFDNVTIKNCNILDYFAGIKTSGHKMIIQYNNINNTQEAISVESGENSSIDHNSIYENNYGIKIFVESSYNSFVGNYLINNSYGMYLFGWAYCEDGGGSVYDSNNNHLINQNWFETNDYAIYTHNPRVTSCPPSMGPFSRKMSNNSIYDNAFTNNSLTIYFNNSNYNFIRTNLLYSTNDYILFDGISANNYIENTTLGSSNNFDITSLSSGTNYLLNTNYDINKINTTNGYIGILWYYYANVYDPDSNPIPGADVVITDNNNTQWFDLLTDTDGKTTTNILWETYMDSTTFYPYTNYTITTSKNGYITDSHKINITYSMGENIYLNKTTSAVPTAPVVYDGLESEDVDWILDNTTLSAHWFNSTEYYTYYVYYKYRVLENGTELIGWTDVGTSTSATITNLTLYEGTLYNFEVYAYNINGLNSNTSESDGVSIDNVEPYMIYLNSSTHETNVTSYNPNPTFNWDANDSISGVAGYSYEIRKENCQNYSTDSSIDTTAKNITITSLTSGNWSMYVKPIDNVGNTGNTSCYQVEIGAVLSVSLDNLASPAFTDTVNVTGHTNGADVDDQESVINIYVNNVLNAENLTCNSGTDFNFTSEINLSDGMNVIYANATYNLSGTIITIISNRVYVSKGGVTNRTLTVDVGGSAIADRITYNTDGFGAATDANVTVAGSSITQDTTDNSIYIFATKDGQQAVQNKNTELEKGEFLDLAWPVFGVAPYEKDTYIISTLLDYANIFISGNLNLPAGRYNLIVTNTGTDSNGNIILNVTTI